MKILFSPFVDTNLIINHEVTKNGSLRIYCDYMMDCLYHGFKTKFGKDLEESILFPQWYTNVDKMKLYGNGFTIYGLIDIKDVSLVLREDLVPKIKDGYYDHIIIPIHNNMYGKDDEILNMVSAISRVSECPVSVICGNDGSHIDYRLLGVCKFFKRELYDKKLQQNLFPINFCVPREKVLGTVPAKNVLESKEKPNHEGQEGWKIADEEEYYSRYRNAWTALTYKKGGWDCMRHYEILMNGCFPFFLDLDKCPTYTLRKFPKEHIISKTQESTTRISMDFLQLLLEYTKEHLTTENIANYILENY